jgi:hypothetical protein
MIGLGVGGFSIFKQIKMENPLRLGQVLVNFLCERPGIVFRRGRAQMGYFGVRYLFACLKVDEEPSVSVLVGVYWHYQYLYRRFRASSAIFLRVRSTEYAVLFTSNTKLTRVK